MRNIGEEIGQIGYILQLLWYNKENASQLPLQRNSALSEYPALPRTAGVFPEKPTFEYVSNATSLLYGGGFYAFGGAIFNYAEYCLIAG